MDNKFCPCCNQEKDRSEFRSNMRKSDGLQSYCRECDKKKQAEHYQKNKKKYIEKSLASRKKKIAWYKEYKGSLKCEKCGEAHPACLQFHHKDPNAKQGTIRQLVAGGFSWNNILLEIEKCQVLCANCHFKHHWNEEFVDGG